MTSDPTPGPFSTPDPDTTAVPLGEDTGGTPPAAGSMSQSVRHEPPVGEARKGLPVAVLAVLGVLSLAILLFVLGRAVDLVV